MSAKRTRKKPLAEERAGDVNVELVFNGQPPRQALEQLLLSVSTSTGGPIPVSHRSLLELGFAMGGLSMISIVRFLNEERDPPLTQQQGSFIFKNAHRQFIDIVNEVTVKSSALREGAEATQ
jgi:hypothetical protein